MVRIAVILNYSSFPTKLMASQCHVYSASFRPLLLIFMSSRLKIEYLPCAESLQLPEYQELQNCLNQSPRQIPSKYFYDAEGSLLFEQICQLPEYYLTRTETEILENSAQAIAQITGNCQIVELGSGSATKTQILLSAYIALAGDQPVFYVPIDISESILTSSAEQLFRQYPTLWVYGLVGDYDLGLFNLPQCSISQRLICFLGSTLGNFSPQQCDAFFDRLVVAMANHDYFLLGVDCHKSEEILTRAYNDSAQVTAEFNLNILRHLNRRFGMNFVPELFRHEAIYNSDLQQIEMYLISQADQIVVMPWTNQTLNIKSGERILTEISRKFSPMDIKQQLQAKGLELLATFSDRQNWYALLLFRRLSRGGEI